MAVKLANNATSSLLEAVSPTATEIKILPGDAEKFPKLEEVDDYFPLTVQREDGIFEHMKVTSRTGGTFTVERAQQDTFALAHAAGEAVSLRLTVGALFGLMP